MQRALKSFPPAAAKEQPASPKPGSVQAAVVDRMEEVRLVLLEVANQRSLYRPLVLRTTSRAVAVLLAVSQGQRLLVKAAGGCPGLHSLSCIGWGRCPEVELHIQFWDCAVDDGWRLRSAGQGVRWLWVGAMLLSCCMATVLWHKQLSAGVGFETLHLLGARVCSVSPVHQPTP